MSVAGRLSLVILTVLAIVVLGLTLSPVLVNDFAHDLGTLPGHLWQLKEAAERDQDLNAQFEAIVKRVEARKRLVSATIEGQLSLLEAARRFCDFAQVQPISVIEDIRRFVPGTTDEERYCRFVIAHVRDELKHRPEKGREVLARLQVELERVQANGKPRPQ
jgi:hypothetical protein